MKRETDSTSNLERLELRGTDQDASLMSRACVALEQAELKDCVLINPGSNYVFLATLLFNGEVLKAIYKPRQGEVPLWDFPDGTLYKREVASFILSEALGWHLVPPTVVREGPYGTGSVQWFVRSKNGVVNSERLKDAAFLKRVALFDYLANNADRKAGHFLEARDGRIWLVDHGLTFNAQPKLRTVLWDFAGQEVPGDLLHAVRGLQDDLRARGRLRKLLGSLLVEMEVQALEQRTEQILNKPSYPQPTSRWSVPWPWY